VRGADPGTRTRLTEALALVADGDARTLWVDRLGCVTGSLRELVALLDWLEAAGASLIARDVDFDSRSRAGRRTIALLRELERTERDPAAGRPARGDRNAGSRAERAHRRAASSWAEPARNRRHAQRRRRAHAAWRRAVAGIQRPGGARLPATPPPPPGPPPPARKPGPRGPGRRTKPRARHAPVTPGAPGRRRP
jgi:Resolvase, N terminal domain